MTQAVPCTLWYRALLFSHRFGIAHTMEQGGGVMNRNGACVRCARRNASAAVPVKNKGSQASNPAADESVQQGYLYWNDVPTDDPVLMPDPQSGDVTDGSVDYYDFEWGETVFHEEASMEPRLFDCMAVCGSRCVCSCEEAGAESDGGACGECLPSGEGWPSCGGVPSDGCADNSPAQQDESEYEFVTE